MTNNFFNILDGVQVQGDLTFDQVGGRVRLQNGSNFTKDANLTANSTVLGIEDDLTLDNKQDD